MNPKTTKDLKLITQQLKCVQALCQELSNLAATHEQMLPTYAEKFKFFLTKSGEWSFEVMDRLAEILNEADAISEEMLEEWNPIFEAALKRWDTPVTTPKPMQPGWYLVEIFERRQVAYWTDDCFEVTQCLDQPSNWYEFDGDGNVVVIAMLADEKGTIRPLPNESRCKWNKDIWPGGGCAICETCGADRHLDSLDLPCEAEGKGGEADGSFLAGNENDSRTSEASSGERVVVTDSSDGAS